MNFDSAIKKIEELSYKGMMTEKNLAEIVKKTCDRDKDAVKDYGCLLIEPTIIFNN